MSRKHHKNSKPQASKRDRLIIRVPAGFDILALRGDRPGTNWANVAPIGETVPVYRQTLADVPAFPGVER